MSKWGIIFGGDYFGWVEVGGVLLWVGRGGWGIISGELGWVGMSRGWWG